jgi:hypothetical protein
MSEYLVNGLRLTVLRQNLEHYQRGGSAPPDAISRMLLSCTDAAWGAIQEAIDKGESAAELWVVKDSALEQIKLLAALAESVLPGAGLLDCVASELKRRLMEHAALTQESRPENGDARPEAEAPAQQTQPSAEAPAEPDSDTETADPETALIRAEAARALNPDASNGRRLLIEEYKAKVKRAGHKSPSDKDIAKAACKSWNDRTNVTRWKRNDPRCTPTIDALIRAALNKNRT